MQELLGDVLSVILIDTVPVLYFCVRADAC